MNEVLNRRLENYLSRLVGYFERPQIFDTDSMKREALRLMDDLNDEREGATSEISLPIAKLADEDHFAKVRP